MVDSSDVARAIAAIEAKDYAEALGLLVPLAESGDFRAIANLATMYQCGFGVQANGQKAVELYMKVARENIREECLSGVAYHNLATIYTMGMPGVQPDPDKAQEFEKLAFDLGFDM